MVKLNIKKIYEYIVNNTNLSVLKLEKRYLHQTGLEFHHKLIEEQFRGQTRNKLVLVLFSLKSVCAGTGTNTMGTFSCGGSTLSKEYPFHFWQKAQLYYTSRVFLLANMILVQVFYLANVNTDSTFFFLSFFFLTFSAQCFSPTLITHLFLFKFFGCGVFECFFLGFPCF